MKRLILILVIIAMATSPAVSSARSYMGGHNKQTVVFGAYAFGPGNRNGDFYYPNAQIPNNWQIAHCLDVFESTARYNWAVEYPTYWADTHERACGKATGNGVTVLKIERWTSTDGSLDGLYWTPVTSFDAAPCDGRSWPGQPAVPWAVANDLFGINCAVNGNDQRWTLPNVG